jgi:tetratricopeptide (TPR) repeat protein
MDNSTPDMNELLVQYLDGELQGADKQSLELRLATDAALQQQFDSLLLTRESIRYYGLNEKVAGIHQQMMQEMKEAPVKKMGGTRKILRYAMSVAASLLLLVGGYIAYQFFSLSAEKVYQANYQPYELSTSRDVNSTETPVEKAYRTSNYKEVVRIYTAKEDISIKAAFLSGTSAMQLKDYPRAISSFTAAQEANKTAPVKLFKDESDYYLALSYIYNHDYDYALELLNAIKEDPAHTYHSKATRKLIRQVKMLKWR